MRESMSVAKLACCAGLAAAVSLGANARGQVVISQVYGGGGNSGATYTNDFIELHNNGTAPVSLAGYSVQYASATGSSWAVTALTGSIPAGGYYLVQEAQGAGGTTPLPTPQATGTIALSGTAGKVALVSSTTALTGTCPTGVVDFVGFGAANCSETSPTPVLSNTTAAIRNNNGCTDAGNNSTDFSVNAPAPRNASTPVNVCGGGSPPSGVGASNPANACPGSAVLLTVAVSQGVPASSIVSVTGDTTAIGGAGSEAFHDDGANGDAVAGDNVYSLATTVFTSTTGGRSVPITITDALGRNGNSSAVVNVIFCGLAGFFSAEPLCTSGGGTTLVTFAVTPAQSPASTGIAVTADLSSIGLSSTQQLFDNGTNGDVTAGDNIFSFLAAPTGVTPGAYPLTATASDAQARTISRMANLNAGACVNSSSTLVISQLYGGGGNTGATFTNDFVELFNRGTTPVSLNGLSIQYASGQDDAQGLGAGSNRLTVLPNATIQPGRYYLVQEAPGAGGTLPLPTPDATGLIAMALDRGTIALVNGTTALGLNSCSNPAIVDVVGYGDGTTPASQGYCNEGQFHAPTTDNTTGVKRRMNGCMDTDNNGIDFVKVTPAPRNSAAPANPCVTGPVCGTADFNGDGDVGTDQDIEAFFRCLAGNCCATCFVGGADFNGDGDVGTDQDIEAFFRVLAGNPC